MFSKWSLSDRREWYHNISIFCLPLPWIQHDSLMSSCSLLAKTFLYVGLCLHSLPKHSYLISTYTAFVCLFRKPLLQYEIGWTRLGWNANWESVRPADVGLPGCTAAIGLTRGGKYPWIFHRGSWDKSGKTRSQKFSPECNPIHSPLPSVWFCK